MTDETFKPKRVKTGGRQKGTRNKSSIEMERAIEAAMVQTDGVDAGKAEQAATFLKRVQTNKALPLHLQMKAAEALLKYEKPVSEERERVVKMPMNFPNTPEGLAAWKVVAQHMMELTEAKRTGTPVDSVTRTIMDIEEAAEKKAEPPK